MTLSKQDEAPTNNPLASCLPLTERDDTSEEAGQDGRDLEANHDKLVQPPAQSSGSIRAKMMSNMLGGHAESLTECLVVVVAGQLLAFNSGFTNGACLSGFLLDNGRTSGVSAFTGAYTGSALNLARGNTNTFGFQVCMILCFILGSCIAGLLTPKAVQYRLEPTYGPTFMLGGIILLTASILEAVDHDIGMENLVFYLVAMANGIQNGMSSLYSGNLIRSTHLTGTCCFAFKLVAVTPSLFLT